MNSSDFIEFAGKEGNRLFISKRDIAYFMYLANRDATEVFVRGVGKPFIFDGDHVDEIKKELNRIV